LRPWPSGSIWFLDDPGFTETLIFTISDYRRVSRMLAGFFQLFDLNCRQ
jgi:hypothetical protein